MIPEKIQQTILQRLQRTEETEGMRILMAIESGSRAWGFASPNSDYDVRFIYARDKDWYVAIDLEERRDVIEYAITDDIDLNGWDVRKALQLFGKSNPAFVEWLQSPIVYAENGCFRRRAQELLAEVYSPEKGIYHYRSMAKTNYRGYLRGDLVPLKKYFYVLRPLLAAKWLETYGTVAPIEFQRLLVLLDDRELLSVIEELLAQKKGVPEMAEAPMIPVLNTFIEAELKRLDAFSLRPSSNPAAISKLNSLFHEVLNEARYPSGSFPRP
jgi:uncharacterized protein